MARTYNIRYRLTWRDSENRWRKIYRGKTFTYAAPEGKCASYHRCWRQYLFYVYRIAFPSFLIDSTVIKQKKTKQTKLKRIKSITSACIRFI